MLTADGLRPAAAGLASEGEVVESGDAGDGLGDNVASQATVAEFPGAAFERGVGALALELADCRAVRPLNSSIIASHLPSGLIPCAPTTP